jgi:hypothetical protein
MSITSQDPSKRPAWWHPGGIMDRWGIGAAKLVKSAGAKCLTFRLTKNGGEDP